VDLTVERIADGEVSPYFHDVLVPGDRVEVELTPHDPTRGRITRRLRAPLP